MFILVLSRSRDPQQAQGKNRDTQTQRECKQETVRKAPLRLLPNLVGKGSSFKLKAALVQH